MTDRIDTPATTEEDDVQGFLRIAPTGPCGLGYLDLRLLEALGAGRPIFPTLPLPKPGPVLAPRR